ncbi:hypothetical protein Tco_0648284 [Tanacetum coccineum]
MTVMRMGIIGFGQLVLRIGDRRIRRLSAYKQWEAASKTDMYRNKKSCYKYQRSIRDYPFKKRRLYQFDSTSNSNHQCDFIEDGTSLSAFHDSHVKLKIKSFRLRVDFDFDFDFVTAIFSGELHVGVMLQGKRIRDDNKTLLQTVVLWLHYPESGSAFTNAVSACHSDWNIEDRLFSVTLNQNQPLSEIGINGLKSLLSRKTPCILNGQLLLTNCLARSLTSITQEALQMCEETVEKVRNCVKYVKTSEPIEDYLPGLKQQLQTEVKHYSRIMDLLLRVMDGSPENSSRAFEIAKFAAGSTTVAAFRVSSSLSITSLLVSMPFLLVCNSNKVNKAEDELLGCICEENRLLSVVVVAYTD